MKPNKLSGFIGQGVLALALSATPLLAQTGGTGGTDQGAGPAGTTQGGATYRADDDRDWGWVGLLGLIGLAGLMRRRDVHDTHDARTTTTNYGTTNR
ncbi:MAG TPA: WGxxGxxG family protein [Blastocatellia bacterium]|nr:WGxxGxxG family protein [Blastocatellia bacterium]